MPYEERFSSDVRIGSFGEKARLNTVGMKIKAGPRREHFHELSEFLSSEYPNIRAGAFGLLDDRYFMYTEEVDLCVRLARSGWECWYVPSAVVTHFGEASTRQIQGRMFVQLYKSKLQFFRNTGGDWAGVRFKAGLALVYLPRWLLVLPAAAVSAGWRRRALMYGCLLRSLPRL